MRQRSYWLPNVQMSSSGAKLYVQAKPKWSMPALRMVCSVLEEADIEIPPVGRSSAPRLFTSPEGRPWGRPRVGSASLQQQQWEAQLGITAASVSAAAKGEVEMAPPCFEEVLGGMGPSRRQGQGQGEE